VRAEGHLPYFWDQFRTSDFPVSKLRFWFYNRKLQRHWFRIPTLASNLELVKFISRYVDFQCYVTCFQ